MSKSRNADLRIGCHQWASERKGGVVSIILITGAGSGFGFRMARRFAAAGHSVYAGLHDLAGGNVAAAQALSAFSPSIIPLQMDVTLEASTDEAVRTIIAREGRIDTVIANAGVWGPGVLEAFSIAEWQALFDVNLFGVLRTLRAVLSAMRTQGDGLVILISSLQGRFILPYSGPYMASKWAAEAAVETIRYEVAPFGVECVIVEPYDYLTEMKQKTARWRPADTAREAAYGPAQTIIEQFYLQPDSARPGDPEQVVDAVARLLAVAPGLRPTRLTVGNPLRQIEAMNALHDEMQRELLPQIGLGHLLGSARRA